MRLTRLFVPAALALTLVAGCKSDQVTGAATGPSGLVVVNGFGAPVDLTIDGQLVGSAVAPGSVLYPQVAAGVSHTVSLRVTGTATSSVVSVTPGAGTALPTAVAAMRVGGGALSAQALTDTNAIVPAGATKMRVLHLAANAGEVQVWRTQPDFMTPIRWAFPFTYNTANTYYQSTPGTWDVRIWTDTSTYAPGNMTPWAALALDQMQVALTSGMRGTVAIVDKPGGGVKLVRLE